MPHSYSSVTVHIVFSTLNRRAQIDSALEERLYPYLGGILHQLGGKLLAVNGVQDHVHLLGSVPPTQTLAEVIGKIKGSSSKWVHDTFPSRSDFAWQRGYGVFSVSPSQIARVLRYIERQRHIIRRYPSATSSSFFSAVTQSRSMRRGCGGDPF